MNVEHLRDVIARNILLNPNDDFGQEKCWRDMVDIVVLVV